ncbi:FHA domain-containing protein [Candidatus Uabimicrobium amorphum]|uniref:FHA domain-containing protein n=1 Tax=Uabimicrobium amorphum TaxID=2596890 RepID=A0A5S9IIM4_UABAM|nr:FHA domain-containing protein [Candidatus Uabimicrobium amorphum]BBM82072.1 hypothetical protein UABAM_00415 [Candidatus Uabimicrobium amorphum]
MNFELRAKGKRYALQINKPQKVIVGREKNCDIYIEDDPLISRQHAIVDFRVNGITITDLKSRNGIFVNGERVRQKVVRICDEIRIGSYIFHILVPQGSQCGKCGRDLQLEISRGKSWRHNDHIYCEKCVEKGVEISRDSIKNLKNTVRSTPVKNSEKRIRTVKKLTTTDTVKSVVTFKRLERRVKASEIPEPQILIIAHGALSTKAASIHPKEPHLPQTTQDKNWHSAFKKFVPQKPSVEELLSQVKQEEKIFEGETIASLMLDKWLRKEVEIALNNIGFEVSIEEQALREVEDIIWQERLQTQKKLK